MEIIFYKEKLNNLRMYRSIVNITLNEYDYFWNE